MKNFRIMSRKFLSFIASIAVLAMVMFTSCGDGGQMRYVAVRLADSDLWSIVDVNTGEILYKDEFKNQPSVIVNGKFCIENESGLWDYYSIDNVKQPINKESYLLASSFSDDDVALVVKKGEPISVINGSCEIVATLDNKIVSASEFENGMAIVVTEDNKIGYVDKNGKVVIKPSYDVGGYFSKDGIAIVGKAANDSVMKYAAIDKSGKELFSFTSSDYSGYGMFHNGHIVVKKERNGEAILLDKQGKKVMSLGKWKGDIPSNLGLFDDIIIFKDGDLLGLKNSNGDIVIRAKYDVLMKPEYNDGYFVAQKDDKSGIIDKDDNEIIPFEYEYLRFINENTLLAVEEENKPFTFINIKGEEVSQNNFIELSSSTGSYINSNYFNAENEADKIMAYITDTSFFNTKKEMTLADFKDKIKGSAYSNKDKKSIDDDGYNSPYAFEYMFDRNLASDRYEYVNYWGYTYRTNAGAAFNYNAKLTSVVAFRKNSLTFFQPGAEDNLAKAFDAKIQKAGFKPYEKKSHYFINEKAGTLVALGYGEGNVFIIYVYNPEYVTYDIPRESRKSDSDEDETYSDGDVVVDTVAVDTVAAVDVN